MKMRLSLLLPVIALSGCATSSGVVVNPSAQRAVYKTAYVVVHGASSQDMDAHVQREFLRHGIAVSVGPEGGPIGNVQLIVRYSDDWRWDLKMYLRSFDVMVFDARTNTLLATGSWENSAMHGFYNEDKVDASVVDQTLSKITAQ
jgi:hypothetical protein